jgi:hypothetical protein
MLTNCNRKVLILPVLWFIASLLPYSFFHYLFVLFSFTAGIKWTAKYFGTIQIYIILEESRLMDVAPCRSCVNRRFGWTYRLHLQGCNHLLTLVLRSRIFLPWRWRRYVPPKRRFTQDLNGNTSQKTALFIITAVKTSNLTRHNICADISIEDIKKSIIKSD